MDNYYNELSQLSILKEEIDRFATSLQNKKAGCFIHRFEQLLNVMPNEFRNQFNFRNKIEDYIKKSNYEKDVKDYILQVFLSFFESIEIEVPNSLRNVVKENESYNEAMIEGYLNFEKANFLEQQKIEIITTQKTKKPKPDPKLKDFFNKDFSSDTISEIQTEFKELRGKDLAILIYLLHREYKIIEIITNSNTKGRKSFVKCLTETDNPLMQGVNKCFEPNTDCLSYSKDDLDFQSLNKRLKKIMEKKVV